MNKLYYDGNLDILPKLTDEPAYLDLFEQSQREGLINRWLGWDTPSAYPRLNAS